jgi:hemoglobin
MATKKDIESRADIDRFIRSFYEQVTLDETIGIIFTQVVKMDWDHHIPVIIDFWETILLDHPVYKNNAMEVHYQLNKIFPLRKNHFDAWLLLFNTIINDMYAGPVTELAKKRAAGIAGLMQYKMNNIPLL